MPKLQDDFILLSPIEFKKFLLGEMRDDRYLRSFYSEIKSIDSKTIQAGKIKVKGVLEFDLNDKFEHEINLNECVFEDEISFKGPKFDILSFTNCTFLNRIRVYNIKLKWFWFNRCEFSKSFIIDNAKIDSFSFSSCSIKDFLNIEGGIYDSVNLRPKEDQKISITGPFTLINYLSINENGSSGITVNKCVINVIQFQGIFNSNSVIVIEDIKLYSLLFKKVINLGKLFLLNISISDTLNKYSEKPINIINDYKMVFKDYDKEGVERSIKTKNIKYLIDYLNDLSHRNNELIKRNLKTLKQFLFISIGNEYSNLLKLKNPH
ncbi:MAG: hypothetical protein GY932_10040 [Arcobacter sp.]|nr:hypothetical protein [Arcobacter sp.]